LRSVTKVSLCSWIRRDDGVETGGTQRRKARLLKEIVFPFAGKEDGSRFSSEAGVERKARNKSTKSPHKVGREAL
jgi:hypothetical protein